MPGVPARYTGAAALRDASGTTPAPRAGHRRPTPSHRGRAAGPAGPSPPLEQTGK